MVFYKTLMYSPLVLQLFVLLARDVSADPGLEPGNDLGQAFVSKFLQLTQDTSSEEYLWRATVG
jgi:hypothetical protein